MKYFVFNKPSDYERGCKEHMIHRLDGLYVEEGYMEKATFWSRILDSASAGTIWHRMTCNMPDRGQAVIRISFYTSDEILFEADGEILDLKKVLRSRELSSERKMDICQPFLKKQTPMEPDILLHSLEGRYLWFLLEIFPQVKEPIGISGLMVYFPAQSWTAKLPEVYRREMGNDSFLDRFLAIYQSIYDDISRQMKEFINCLDVEVADICLLRDMASWMGIEEPYMWTKEQLRYLLSHAREFSGARGTKRGLEMFGKLYTKELPFVIEWQEWQDHRETHGRLLKSLYADDPYSITVLVRAECIKTYKDHQALLRVLEKEKPIQMTLRLVVLEPYIFMDRYSYLGVNSVLGEYENASLGNSSRLDLAAISDNELEEMQMERDRY
ncbi:MAG: hypothetical protein J1E61_08220 [Lachnospiraceae bacterium]|nr:hypothetical protein [Lachnospiraceae bacterium]